MYARAVLDVSINVRGSEGEANVKEVLLCAFTPVVEVDVPCRIRE